MATIKLEMRTARSLAWLMLGVASMAGLKASVYSPRVLSPHVADTYSLKTFAEFHRWRDLNGDAKVYEIFQYLIDPRTGIYPMGVPAWEGDEEMSEFAAVREPIKMLNVYPIGHCGTLGPTMAGIMQGMGIGPARTLILPAWNHVASEVFYDARWHYLDLDVRAIFRRADGSLASMAEAQQDASLWNRPNSPDFFPLDALPTVRAVYQKTAVRHYYGHPSGGHTMDFVLRQGETFTRWWKPQGGRWNHHSSYGAEPFPRTLIQQEPRGPKCKHASFTVHAHGNGQFVYRPNLTSKSTDFEDGVYSSQNLAPSSTGLTLRGRGEGHAIFEVRTPYVIAPLVGNLDAASDDREASVVRVDADEATVSLSMDNGLTWKELGPANGTHDLTRHVSGTYGYLLKLALRGEPNTALVRSIEMTTWVQVHPASLPSLRKGRNEMRLITGDHHGLQTRVLEIRPSAARADEFVRHLAEPPKDYDPARRTSRVRGTMTAKVQAPPGSKIAWFSVGASFTTHQREAALNTRNTMAYAAEASEQFEQIYRSEIPADQDHWHFNVDREVKLQKPAGSVLVRYVGDPGLNNLRIYAHCLEDRANAATSVTATHVWIENGLRKSKTVTCDPGAAYVIETESDPVDESISLAISSVLRR
ncbi:MAG: hypothetical protein HYY23_01205 [Verrucomicrobia bacterium]|nr:hypothetical protein [Verrucomicrobiota bacterium]